MSVEAIAELRAALGARPGCPWTSRQRQKATRGRRGPPSVVSMTNFTHPLRTSSQVGRVRRTTILALLRRAFGHPEPLDLIKEELDEEESRLRRNVLNLSPQFV